MLFLLVRSFGTEGRPTDRPVPARDEIFEYIIFRGADIEDLQVREPPQSTLTQDPAIVEVDSIIDHICMICFVHSSHPCILLVLVPRQLEQIIASEVVKRVPH